MKNAWASPGIRGESDDFDALHAGLTVRLIATSRAALKTCRPDERVSDVVERNVEGFDFLPVIEMSAGANEKIVGLLSTKASSSKLQKTDKVGSIFSPLSEELVIGADSSILEFVSDADSKPCRLVVSGARIEGLVSLSDLQKLPVRAALFALITGFEITMMDAIRKWYASEADWMGALSPTRQKKVSDQKLASKISDGWVDSLLFTQFCDKRDLIIKGYPGDRDKTSLLDALKEIEKLRDFVAHANDYASSPEQATEVCGVVRCLRDLRRDIAKNII
jgi:hypothetical protein